MIHVFSLALGTFRGRPLKKLLLSAAPRTVLTLLEGRKGEGEGIPLAQFKRGKKSESGISKFHFLESRKKRK